MQLRLPAPKSYALDMATRPTYDPQKAILVAEPPTGPRWVHELKLDGYRMGLFITRPGKRRQVSIVSRNGNDWTDTYPEVVDAALALPCETATLDGEVVILNDRGLSDFQALQNVGSHRRGLRYFAFDLLMINGENLTAMALEDRKRRLEMLIGESDGAIRYTPHFLAEGAEVLKQACRLGAEGIVSKCRDTPYRSGQRSYDWQKSKCTKRQDFVVGGFTEPERSRTGIGALLLGYYEKGTLRFAGKVGTGKGWTDAFGRAMRTQLERVQVSASPFSPAPPRSLSKNAHWVQPLLVAEVQFTEWTDQGWIRHPSLQGFRSDKLATDVTREREASR